MGLSGTGKTTFSNKLDGMLKEKGITVELFNADKVRKESNNWQFDRSGRIAQAVQMATLAENSKARVAIADFIAPTSELRKLFSADYVVWMDTKNSSKYKDTDKIFTAPEKVNYIITVFDDVHVQNIADEIQSLLND